MKFIKKKKGAVDVELETAYAELALRSPGSKEYYDILRAIRELEDLRKGRGKLDPVVIGAVVNLTGILMVLTYEYVRPVTSKAFSMIHKTKI